MTLLLLLFQALYWLDSKKLFDPEAVQWVEEALKDTFAIHYSNYGLMDGEGKGIVLSENQPFFQLMLKNCPLTVEERAVAELGKPL